MDIPETSWLSEPPRRCLVALIFAGFILSAGGNQAIQSADIAAFRIPDVNADPILPFAAALSWRDVQDAISEGEQLPSADPEPYYARAEIWSKRLENQEEALLDTLRGVEIFLDGKDSSDPAEISNALKKLRDAAWLSLQRPKSIYPGAAEKHYCAGLRFYSAGQVEDAVAQFTRAILLDPNCPIYYYFRSLARLSAGDGGQAIIDAEKGAMIESHLTEFARSEVSRSLMRVQGKHRLWLEGYRRGRPTYDPRRDQTLPARLTPDSRSTHERSRIEGVRTTKQKARNSK